MDKLQKKELVKGLQEKLSTAKVVITTDYKGLDVAAISDLRRKLKEAGVEYQVVKNTLLRRVAKDNQMALMEECFKGPSAIKGQGSTSQRKTLYCLHEYPPGSKRFR